MRKLIAIILLMTMCLTILPASAEGITVSYGRIAQMGLYMRELAAGDYMSLNGVEESVQRKAREWTAGINDAPRLVIRLDLENSPPVVSSNTIYMNEHPMVRFEAASNVVVEIISYCIAYAAMENVVAESAYEEIARVNMGLNSGMIYADAEAEDGMALYLVLYEDAQPLLILAIAENDAVSLNGWVLPSKGLSACSNYGQVLIWFMRNSFPMTGEEVRPE